MNRRVFPLLLPALLILPAASVYVGYAGGWATITVEDVPDGLVAGSPVELSFIVRQHGVRPLSELRPSLEARSGRLATTVAASPGRAAGQYRASLTVPEPGDWTITIHSGFGRSRTTLLPIRAVAPGARVAAAASDVDRGHQLFLAKGCVTCHVHRAAKGQTDADVGPELTARRYQADYLAKFLADPSIGGLSRSPNSDARMPDLELKPAEITALVAFLNRTERQASR